MGYKPQWKAADGSSTSAEIRKGNLIFPCLAAENVRCSTSFCRPSPGPTPMASNQLRQWIRPCSRLTEVETIAPGNCLQRKKRKWFHVRSNAARLFTLYTATLPHLSRICEDVSSERCRTAVTPNTALHVFTEIGWETKEGACESYDHQCSYSVHRPVRKCRQSDSYHFISITY